MGNKAELLSPTVNSDYVQGKQTIPRLNTNDVNIKKQVPQVAAFPGVCNHTERLLLQLLLAVQSCSSKSILSHTQ